MSLHTMCILVSCSYFSNLFFFYPSKLAASFQSMEVRNSNFAAFIDVFTSNTYVMVIMSDPSIRKCQRAKFLCSFSKTAKCSKKKKKNSASDSQHLQPLSSTFEMPGNTLRSWSVWTDPSTACTCGCASQYFSLCPLGPFQPITPQMT